ncbi:tRNA pseudouridine(13) synthase TruD [Polyangium jinanense]|uniref:tRNA pseudouridine synthase D n=1 Tax=Polyangium jinanense TaxID=2829994 RepID=A0A9X4AY95_9BACT|nr:tRNA pseudouridine(13) synthase TruD [Polyangium jinanense]MDC3959148.1 tRNA pseudouridine(13) synthase TruD [Polyangium jinanense]MDC3989453.1 tRNA pseudouridine(13) synthase TruD [Polyangium jinanense]
MQAPLPIARIRTSPEDFVVEEIPAYAPSGKGEHLYVTLRKTGKNTPDVARDLARSLGADPRGTGWAGMKDRHAITTQTISIQVPIAEDAEAKLAQMSLPGVEILGAARHGNKLKPGHLVGNRFTITLRGLAQDDAARVGERLAEAGRVGVPNSFGPQRFGRDGQNPARALAWLRGEERGPRDRREQRLLFSALQSMLFNEVLGRRVEAGTWAAVLPGDLAKKHDSGGIFAVPAEGRDLDDAKARAEAGAISATGPMFGAKMRWPEGTPRDIEREVLATVLPDASRLEAFRALGEGTRRPLRLMVADMLVRPIDASGGLTVSFVLPKGGYATTVLATACQIVDATSRASDADGGDEGDESSSEPSDSA